MLEAMRRKRKQWLVYLKSSLSELPVLQLLTTALRVQTLTPLNEFLGPPPPPSTSTLPLTRPSGDGHENTLVRQSVRVNLSAAPIDAEVTVSSGHAGGLQTSVIRALPPFYQGTRVEVENLILQLLGKRETLEPFGDHHGEEEENLADETLIATTTHSLPPTSSLPISGSHKSPVYGQSRVGEQDILQLSRSDTTSTASMTGLTTAQSTTTHQREPHKVAKLFSTEAMGSGAGMGCSVPEGYISAGRPSETSLRDHHQEEEDLEGGGSGDSEREYVSDEDHSPEPTTEVTTREVGTHSWLLWLSRLICITRTCRYYTTVRMA